MVWSYRSTSPSVDAPIFNRSAGSTTRSHLCATQCGNRPAAASKGCAPPCRSTTAGVALPPRANRLAAQAIDEVKQRHHRMAKQHARTGVPHNDSDPLPHFRPVAVHWALGARRLAILEWALVETGQSIAQELPALRTGPVRPLVMPDAADAYHRLDSPGLSRQSRMFA